MQACKVKLSLSLSLFLTLTLSLQLCPQFYIQLLAGYSYGKFCNYFRFLTYMQAHTHIQLQYIVHMVCVCQHPINCKARNEKNRRVFLFVCCTKFGAKINPFKLILCFIYHKANRRKESLIFFRIQYVKQLRFCPLKG